MSIFKPRQSGGSSTNTPVPAAVADSNISTIDTPKSSPHELTKNEKYCVSTLPALPPVLHNASESNILNGYTDYRSNHAIVIDSEEIYVWNYKSTDPSPLCFQFPLEPLNGSIPLAILTTPSNGSTDDPGLVIINSETGLVKFYESVQHAPALGLINNKSLETYVNILSNHGEYITLAENIEPAGIAIATSWKRVVLVTLRDFKGKPQLSMTQLIGPSKSSSIFSGFFSRGPSDTKMNNEIVSIKSGKVSNNGSTQEIIVQDSNGGFHNFTFHSLSANGVPYIESKKTVKHSIAPYLENNLDGFIPGSSFNIKFLDLWPLEVEQQENIYAALVFVYDNFKTESEKSLLVITLKIDQSGVLLYGSHRLTTYDKDIPISLVNKPRLYIPKPGVAAFVILDNAIILTDIKTNYIDSQSINTYYSPRWEDVVKLKSSVQLIGQGYENPSTSSNPSLILLTKNSGVIRVERFKEEDSEMDVDVEANSNDPITIIKSHIEQGIFYNGSSTIDFDIKETYDDETTIEAVKQIISDILYNKSPYLPAFLPSIKDFLRLKLNLFHELISYASRNFSQVFPQVLPIILKPLEMTDVSLNFYNFINNDQGHVDYYKSVLKDLIVKENILDSPTDDLIRSFFSQGTEYINGILTDFIARLIADSTSLDTILDILVSTVYNGVFLNEQKYIMGNEVEIFRLWVFDTDLLIRLEEVFSNAYCGNNGDFEILSSTKIRSALLHLTETLYYLCTNAIQFMQWEGQSDEQLKEYLRWYRARKYDWIHALMKYGLNEEAITIAEKYQDFQSLAEVLESEKDQISNTYVENSVEYITLLKRYELYFEKYEYKFASSLYDFYLKSDKIKSLLLNFDNYKPYLVRYFQENPKKTAEVAWIREVLDEDFALASKTLINSAEHDVDGFQNNRELKYSLGKLAAIAAKSGNSGDVNVRVLDEYVGDCENHLTLIEIQDAIYNEVLKSLHGEEQLITFDFVLSNYINRDIGSSAKEIIEPFFGRFSHSQQLSRNELIELSTLIKPSVTFSEGFANALKVSALLLNDQSFSYYCQLTWLRLLTTTDDWSIVKESQNLSDEESKKRLTNTILYKTLKKIGADSPLVEELTALTESKGESVLNHEDGELNRKLVKKLASQLSEYNLGGWIEALRADIRTSYKN